MDKRYVILIGIINGVQQMNLEFDEEFKLFLPDTFQLFKIRR